MCVCGRGDGSLGGEWHYVGGDYGALFVLVVVEAAIILEVPAPLPINKELSRVYHIPIR